jgi:small-conductance mechanosensitive channel
VASGSVWERGPLPLDPETLERALAELPEQLEKLWASGMRLLLGHDPGVPAVPALVGGLLAGLLLGIALRASVHGAGPPLRPRSKVQNWTRAFGDFLHRNAFSLAVPTALLIALELARARTSVTGTLVTLALILFAGYRIGLGLFPLLVRPLDPYWLRRRLADPQLARLWRHTRLLLGLGLIGVFLAAARHALAVPSALQAVVLLLYTLALAGVLWRLRERTVWEHLASTAGHPLTLAQRYALDTARLALALLATALVVSAALGYRALTGHLVAYGSLSLGILAIAAVMGTGLSRLVRRLEWRRLPRPVEAVFGRGGVALVVRFTAALTQAGVFLIAVVGVLALWGVPLGPVERLVGPLLWGADGGPPVSLVSLAAALLVLAATLVGGRWLRDNLHERYLAEYSPDEGVRNSIASLTHYAVLVVGVLITIAVAGFDLTNLALVAGALSVGIGFGLQNVVNNFVSGLILLFERPIKVGDIVEFGGRWGEVQRIRVRSTEIQTFDRAELIVPNSELVSVTVTNWTHTNQQIRIILQVGVAYDSDVSRVRNILYRIAADNPLIYTDPEPLVLFQDFGDSALRFELRCHTHLDNMLTLPSELRFRVVEEFRRAGITIPFPQRDIHVYSAEVEEDAENYATPGSLADPDPLQ